MNNPEEEERETMTEQKWQCADQIRRALKPGMSITMYRVDPVGQGRPGPRYDYYYTEEYPHPKNSGHRIAEYVMDDTGVVTVHDRRPCA